MALTPTSKSKTNPKAAPSQKAAGPSTRKLKKQELDRHSRRRTRMLLSWVAVLLVAGLVAGFVLTNAGNTGGLNTSLHQHPHISIYVSGVLQTIPPDIGIEASLWKDHSMDEYQQMQTMSPIHTHESDGTIHLEMAKWHPCTLGNFFDVWGQPFDRDRVLSHSGPVSLTVDGNPSDQYRDLVLQDGQQIVIRGG